MLRDPDTSESGKQQELTTDCHRTCVLLVGYSGFHELLRAQLVLCEGWQKALAVPRSCAHPQKAGTTGKGEITLTFCSEL